MHLHSLRWKDYINIFHMASIFLRLCQWWGSNDLLKIGLISSALKMYFLSSVQSNPCFRPQTLTIWIANCFTLLLLTLIEGILAWSCISRLNLLSVLHARVWSKFSVSSNSIISCLKLMWGCSRYTSDFFQKPVKGISKSCPLHNFPMYEECKTQSVKVLALPGYHYCQYDLNITSQPLSRVQLIKRTRWPHLPRLSRLVNFYWQIWIMIASLKGSSAPHLS